MKNYKQVFLRNKVRFALLLLIAGVLSQPVAAQQTTETSSRTSDVNAPPGTGSSPSSRVVLPTNINPFTAIDQVADQGRSFKLTFKRTEHDSKAEGTARVVLVNNELLVHMTADDMPLPSHFDVPRYALWVYVPNYAVKMYIGDLPITSRSASTEQTTQASAASNTPEAAVRGSSDSAYRYTVLPPGAQFGGLMLTAEPIRYTRIVNEALRPVLVAFVSEEDKGYITAPAIYTGTIEDAKKEASSGSSSAIEQTQTGIASAKKR